MTFKKSKTKLLLIVLSLVSLISCSQSTGGDGSIIEDTGKPYLYVSQKDYTKENLTQILSKETTEEMTRRSFYTDKPIQVSIDKGSLKITSYAPVTVHNIDIIATRKNDNKSIKLAHYDTIYGFSESIFNIPESLNITNENTTFKVVSDNDDFIAKINTIKSPLLITFAQGNGGPWQAITPETSREAAIVGITMSYMFNHKDYKEHLKQWNEGGYVGKEVVYSPIPGFPPIVWLPSAPLKDDNGNPLSHETVSQKALNRGQINFSLIKDSEPAGGIGGGNMLGIRKYLFDNFTNYNNLPYNGQKQKDLKCYVVDVLFHELAHCMGYFHPDNQKDYKGTMTYGGGWTTANYVFLNKLVEQKDLPVQLDGNWAANIGFPAL